VFHVLNRGVERMKIFRHERDYDAFRRVVEQALRAEPMRICACCLAVDTLAPPVSIQREPRMDANGRE
jgi:REP element-mobilizing transposase RayT